MDDRAAVDALVIGGGPGGLAAAIYLARFRRSVLVVDAGASRAATIPRSRNYPGFADGVPGVQLLAAIRDQAARYGVRFAPGTVRSLATTGDGFDATWDGGTVRARKVVLASGVTDVPPAMPHLRQALQDGALRYCPVCDGFEAIGQTVGILADSGADTFEALYLRHFSDRVLVFIARPDVRFTEVQRRQMTEAGVVLVDEPVDTLRLVDARVRVRHGERETTVDALYCALGMDVHSDLAVKLGAEHDRNGYLVTDSRQQTTVSGLYAVGDVARGLNQIAVATGDAAVAASAIQLALMGRG